MKSYSTRDEQRRIVALGKILALAESICPTDEGDPLYVEIVGIEARASDSIEAIQAEIRLRRLRDGFESLKRSLFA